MKTSELSGPALEYWFMKATGKFDIEFPGVSFSDWMDYGGMPEMFGWADVGPIIEQEAMSIKRTAPSDWCARAYGGRIMRWGDTPLIAAMRCFVASKFGNEVPDAQLGSDKLNVVNMSALRVGDTLPPNTLVMP